MSKFIQCINGDLLNADHIVLIRTVQCESSRPWAVNGKVEKSYAFTEDGTQHEVYGYEVHEDILTTELVPACPDDKVIIGYVMDDGDPCEEFEMRKVVAWRIGSCGATPVIDDYDSQGCSNAVIGLIEWDGSVFIPSDRQFNDVEGFKAYITARTLGNKLIGGVK